MKKIIFALLFLFFVPIATMGAAPDTFDSHFEQLSVPADNADAVTYDTEFANVSRGIYCGSAGDVAVYMKGKTSAVTFKGCQAGQTLPIRADQVRTTNTTVPAADLLVLY